jgi:hypothetical protein
MYVAALVLVLLWLGTLFIEDHGTKGLVGVQGTLAAFLWTALVVSLQGAIAIFWRQRMSAKTVDVLIGLLIIIPGLALIPLAVNTPLWEQSIVLGLILAFLVGMSFGSASVFSAALAIAMHGGGADSERQMEPEGE